MPKSHACLVGVTAPSARSNGARSKNCGPCSGSATEGRQSMPDDRRDDPEGSASRGELGKLELSRYWNDLAGDGGADPGPLDPATAEVVRRVQRLAAAPVPSAAFDRVWARLMARTDPTERARVSAGT